MAPLVQDGIVVGWSLTDPVRYLTAGFTSPAPAALARLREIHRALRAQREERHRADALLGMIATFVEDYGR
ncbi:hypothetical protein [Streptomyces prasinus]